MKITDKGLISKPVKTGEGYLVCDVDFARVGVQEYYNYQFWPNIVEGKSLVDRVGVLRPEEEVFDEDSMNSFTLLPLTQDHPLDFLDSENAKFLTVGTSGGEVRRNGIYLNTRIKVTDAEVVKEIMENGKKQFSAGYNAEIVAEKGVYDGKEYHFVQRNIRGNHIAVAIDNARCGAGCSIKDNNEMKKSILVTIADQKVDLSDDVKAEIKKIEDSANKAEQKLADAEKKAADAEKKLADAEKKVEEIQANWDSCKAGKEQEIAALTAKLDDATSKIKSQEQIDAIVEERVQLVADCKEIFADVDTKLSNSEMKKAVVKEKCADIADSIDEKSAEYIEARFDILKNQKHIDSFNVKNGDKKEGDELVDSQAVRKTRFANK